MTSSKNVLNRYWTVTKTRHGLPLKSVVVCVITVEDFELLTWAPGAVVTGGGAPASGGTVMAPPSELRIVLASVIGPRPEVDRPPGGLPGGGGGGGGGAAAPTRFWL